MGKFELIGECHPALWAGWLIYLNEVGHYFFFFLSRMKTTKRSFPSLFGGHLIPWGFITWLIGSTLQI
jgi:hypothetical protein